MAQQLKNYVTNGGSVVLFPDLDVNQQDYSGFLKDLSLPGIQRLSEDTVNVSTIDLKSNLFSDVFEHVPAQLDLPKINRRFIYEQASRSTREDILGLPLAQLFFARYPTGTGQFYLTATSLTNKDSNFPEHPVFVPLLYKIAFSSVQEQPLYYTLGKNTLLQLAQLNLNANQSLKLSSATLEAIPEVRQTPGKTLLYVADQIKAPGFYELKKADSLVTIYAFNDNRAESDMQYTPNEALEKLFGRQKINVNNSGASLQAGGAENNHTELWKLCLVLCAVFLAVEVALIRFLNNTKNIQTT